MGEPQGPWRVLQVAGSAAGGTRWHVRELAAALAAQHRVLLAAPDAVATPAVPHVRHVAVEITDRPRAGDGRVVARLRALARGADIVHAHGLRAGALAALALTGLEVPLVVTVHNLPVGGPAVEAVAAALQQVVARRAGAVLAVSGDLVDHMRGLGARHAERALIPAPVRHAAPADRAALGVGTGPLVVTVARLAPQKGIDLLLDVAGLLADRLPDLVWVVAGDGPLAQQTAQAIEDEALDVRLLGRREDTAALLAAADVVVSTAQWEGQPLWLQEALHAGAPIVATDVGGTREVTGMAARLVPAGDADALASQITTVLREPAVAEGLRAAALARAQQLPTPRDALTQVHDIYRSMLG